LEATEINCKIFENNGNERERGDNQEHSFEISEQIQGKGVVEDDSERDPVQRKQRLNSRDPSRDIP
jgi:hypothetical protein